MTLPECGFLIVKETPSPSSMAVLIGMNIISKCWQIVHAEFDTTMGGRLDYNWRVAFQQAQSVELVERVSFARVAGKTPAYVPAWSATTVLIKGLESEKKGWFHVVGRTSKHPLTRRFVSSAYLVYVRVTFMSSEST